MNRRSLLRGLLALPFVPLLAKLKPPVRPALILEGLSEVQPIFWSNTSDIIAATIESRSKCIADNIYKNNALLMALRNRTPEQRRASELARWKNERFAFYRSDTVRIDSRCPSNYAAWRERMAA